VKSNFYLFSDVLLHKYAFYAFGPFLNVQTFNTTAKSEIELLFFHYSTSRLYIKL